MPNALQLPPMLQNAVGEPRRVGFEIEFTGISLIQTANIIAQLFEGEIEQLHRNRILIKTPLYGKFVVELDVKLLQRLSQEVRESQLHPEVDSEQIGIQLKSLAVDLLSPVLVNVAPTEVVTPPLTFEALPQLEQLSQALRKHCARGTHASVIYAFGVHINPELPNFEVTTLYNYTLAFALLYDWLKDKSQIDLTRQATLFARAYPKAYVALLLDKTYTHLGPFIEDYLQYNLTRNRALDLLPLLSYLEPDSIRARLIDDRIKPRPTFHYRLPNCQIDEVEWSVLESWNLWVKVEQLAYQPKKLRDLAQRYKCHLHSLYYNLTADDWVAEVEQWLNANL